MEIKLIDNFPITKQRETELKNRLDEEIKMLVSEYVESENDYE